MTLYSLDQIVRSLLLKEGKTLHWYIKYLKIATDAVQLLHTTSFRKVNSVKLPVNSYNSVTLPPNYVDFVQVGYVVGERVRPMIQDNRLNRLNNFDSLGNKIVYPPAFPDGTSIDDLTIAGNINPLYDVPINGFYDRALFNRPTDRDDYMFKVLPKRNEIQLSASFPYDFIILDHITDGLETDDATRIDPDARDVIEKYIMFQKTLHTRSASEGEKQEAERRFNSSWRLYRAMKNPLTKQDIIHAVRSGYSGLGLHN